jgi:hypothetical protein
VDWTISDAKNTMPYTMIRNKVKMGSAPDLGAGED